MPPTSNTFRLRECWLVKREEEKQQATTFHRPPMLILSFRRDSAHHSNGCGAIQQHSIEVRQGQRARQKYGEEVRRKKRTEARVRPVNTAPACLASETHGTVVV